MTRWERKYVELLEHIKSEGHQINPSRGGARELIAYQFALADPRDRLLANPVREWNLLQAIGQWIWISSARDDLAAIEYYTKSVVPMSTDELTLLGAYGPRLFGSAPYNQVAYAVQKLQRGGSTRRAVCSIYLPTLDQHDLSEEVPCTLCVQFLRRENRLHMITTMRSQDATKVLPYDVFMFTMLQEYVAARLQDEVGSYYHQAGSFHVYERDKELLGRLVASKAEPCGPMPPMPSQDLDKDIRAVRELERDVRAEVVQLRREQGLLQRVGVELRREHNLMELGPYLARIEEMHDYWKNFCYMLLAYGALQTNSLSSVKAAVSMVRGPFTTFAKRLEEKAGILTTLDSFS